MSTSDKVKAVLQCVGKKQTELAAFLGMRPQNLATKMMRDSWHADDLIKVAVFTGAKIGFFLPDGTSIYLEPNQNDNEKKNAREK